MNKNRSKRNNEKLLQESVFMIQPENIFLSRNEDLSKDFYLDDSESENIEQGEQSRFEENYYEENQFSDDENKPTIGKYGNFQGVPFDTDYYIDRSLLKQYMEKDEAYPFLSYLNMNFDSIEDMNDRIDRRVNFFDYETPLYPEDISSQEIENDSNMILNNQGIYLQNYSLEQKEKKYNNYNSYDDNIKEMKKYMKIFDN